MRRVLKESRLCVGQFISAGQGDAEGRTLARSSLVAASAAASSASLASAVISVAAN